MSKARRERRAAERAMEPHLAVLNDFLGRFYTFLESTPKPSDEEVRARFITYDQNWRRYCKSSHLNSKAELLFNQEVALAWKNRYSRIPMIEKKIQK